MREMLNKTTFITNVLFMILNNASFIMLMGGNPYEEKKLIEKLDVVDELKNYKGIMLGYSAGAMLMSKYQYFLKFIPPEEEYIQEFDKLLAYDDRVKNLSRMMDDTSIRRMRSDNAEEYGLSVYGEPGGSYAVLDPQVLQDRLDSMQQRYSEIRDECLVKLADYGMKLSDDNKIINEIPYNFEDVKALDIHHLLYDFPYDFPISQSNSSKFAECATTRYELFQKAKNYLERSGQKDAIKSLPDIDIELQKSTADRFVSDTTLHTKRETSVEKRKATKTISMSYNKHEYQDEEIKNIIKNTINSLQYE